MILLSYIEYQYWYLNWSTVLNYIRLGLSPGNHCSSCSLLPHENRGYQVRCSRCLRTIHLVVPAGWNFRTCKTTTTGRYDLQNSKIRNSRSSVSAEHIHSCLRANASPVSHVECRPFSMASDCISFVRSFLCLARADRLFNGFVSTGSGIASACLLLIGRMSATFGI